MYLHNVILAVRTRSLQYMAMQQVKISKVQIFGVLSFNYPGSLQIFCKQILHQSKIPCYTVSQAHTHHSTTNATKDTQ